MSVSEQDWIAVTPAPLNLNQAFWSPDGKLIYYVANSAASFSLMARHIDRNLNPVDPPFRVFELPSRIHPQFFQGFNAIGTLSAVPGRFIRVMPELSFNVWMMDLPK
jgi:hypothetical protein